MKRALVYLIMVFIQSVFAFASLDIQFTPANPSICKGKSITIHAQLTGAGTGTFTFPYTKVTGSEIFISPNGNDITGTGTISNPYKTIQKGINVSSNGIIVTLLDGTYSGSGNVNVTLQGKQITIQSQNGPLSTSIDCNQNGRAFMVNQGETMNTVIKGITIMNGKTNSAPNGYGSAIFVEDNSGISIKDCFFRSNTQGSIQLGDTEVSGPQSKIENCAFIGNIEGCIHASKKSFMVETCLFINNTGSGGLVGNGHVANPAQEYKNCVFVCNSGSTVAGINHGKVISNSLFISNTTNLGVVYAGTNWSGMNTIDHCSFYNNTCSYYNSNWYDHVGAAKSSIFYPGDARNHVSGKQSDIPFTKCLGGNIPGNGNISGDPKFVDPAGFDFALQSSSPCIGTGEGGTNMGANVSLIPSWLLQYVKANTTLASISWDGGSKNTSATFSPTTTKYHKVTFSGCGLSYTDSILITVKDDVTYTTIDTSCNDYTWNGKVYTISGKYTEKLTSHDGCDSNVVLDLYIAPKPNPIITGNNQICLGVQNVQYSVPSVANSSFLWKQPQKGVIGGSLQQNSIIVNWSSLGIDTLFLTQTNLLNGCSKDTFLIVQINSRPNPLINGDKLACVNSKIIEYSANPKSPGLLYQWSTPKKGIIKSGMNTSSINIDWDNIGIDTLTLTMTDNITGCSKDTMIIVQIHPKPIPIINGSNIICLGMKNVKYSVPNAPSSSFLWKQPKKGMIKGPLGVNEISMDWLIPGTDTIHFTQTNLLTGCMQDTFMVINIYHPPAPLISGNTLYCISDKSTQFSVKPQVPDFQYEWKKPSKGTILNSLNSPNIIIDWNGEGIDTITVSVTDTKTGCSKDTIHIVKIIPLPKPVISGNDSVCEQSKGIQYEVAYKPGYLYEWKQPKLGIINGNTKSSIINVDWNMQGIDTLRVTEKHEASQCSKDTIFIVSIQKTLIPTVLPFAEEYFLCEGDSRGLECTLNADFYSWNYNGVEIPSSNSQIILAFKPGKYSVYARTGQCEGESSEIEILEKEKPNPKIVGPKECEEMQKNIVYHLDSTLEHSTFEWSISGNGIISGNQKEKSVIVESLDSGIVILTAREKTIFDCINKDTFLIHVKKTTLSNIYEQIQQSIQFIPHPIVSGEIFNIHGFNLMDQECSIEFLDILGRLQYRSTDIRIMNGILQLVTPQLQDGIYHIRIATRDGYFSQFIHISQ